ncbi:hypothetical protein [Polyangium sp. 15x6]|uniref:hypothetical protein n=1 Tax=Polyangium sp. 15x6 TaxID=3042687 RepID=UPI00249C9F25|nr:hypothetical protein [Polyangium sp. 15x6]MDI3285979.1 hypothetical protein [Polyangium sp. 15x6]
MLLAHIEVISTRDPASGVAPDPCVHPIQLPPPNEAMPHTKFSLRTTALAADGSNAEIRHLAEVAAIASCSPEGGFYFDNPRAATHIHRCPTSCAWVRGATHGVRVDVLASAH